MQMTEFKQVTIIVPIFNAIEHLKQCLDSIVKQDYYNLQILLIDDGSTDGSGEICDEYSLRDDRISVVHNVNSGLVRARKEGLKYADGEYIGFVDSDDYIDSDMISSLVSFMERTGADFIHSGYQEFCGEKNTVQVNFTERVFDFVVSDDRTQFIEKYILDLKSGMTISYSIWSKLFRREVIQNCYNRIDDSCQYGEDALCLTLCSLECSRIAFLPKAFYHYRVNGESMSHGQPDVILPQKVKLCSKMIMLFEEYGYSLILQHSIYEFLKTSFLEIMNRDINLNQFYLENTSDFKDKRVVLYGAGAVGHDYYVQLLKENVELLGIIDEKVKSMSGFDRMILKPEEISSLDYDTVIVAVYADSVFETIKKTLLDFGVPEKRIYWERPHRYF